jgi:hypothetical protein
VLRGVEVPAELADEPLEGLPFIELFYQWLGAAGYSLAKSALSNEYQGQGLA